MQQANGFKIGDVVVVVNAGATYDYGAIYARDMGLTSFVSGAVPVNGLDAKVIAVVGYDRLGIEQRGRQFVVQPKAVRSQVVNQVLTLPPTKQDWSFPVDRSNYNKVKEVLILLGYTFTDYDEYDSNYRYMSSSDFCIGRATQSDSKEANHFESLTDFLIFHLDVRAELKQEIAAKRAELEALEKQLNK